MTVDLNGARVLLTGASGGIGAGLARAFHARGATLILTGRRGDALEGLAAETGAAAIPADLADAGQVADLLDRSGPIDVLVNNAALPAVGPVVDFTDDHIDRALDVNVRAPIVLARSVTPALVGQGRGHIVFVGSLSSRVATPGVAIYTATKFAVRGFALAHRQDLHGTGVGVSIVEPGFVSDAGMYADSGMTLPRGVRTVSPDAVAKAVIRSIERNVAEIVVAPVEQRIQNMIGMVAPSLDALVQRTAGIGDAFAAHSGASEKR